MSAFHKASRRPADVPHTASNNVHRSQCPDFVESSGELGSSPLRAGTVHEDGRPNNWQDCYAWPDSSTNRATKKTVKMECYDKWARHFDPKNQKEKSKTNNITHLSLMPPMLDLQSKMPTIVKQRLPGKKAVGSEMASRTADGFENRYDSADLLKAVHPVSNSLVKDDGALASSCIWTALSDLLPQSKASLNQMSSSEMVTRVMNIRDKLQSASSFRVTLSKQPDSEMTRLQRDYLDAIVEILQRQESCFMIALKRSIVEGEDIHSPPNAAELGSPKSDSKSEGPTELDVSGSSSDELGNEFAARGPEIPLNNQRPIIEDHLGHYSDSDLEELQQKLKRLNERVMTDCMVLPREHAYASSNLSPRSPAVDDGSARNRNFEYDSVLAVGQDASGQMPLNAFMENLTPRQTLKTQRYGQTKSPSAVTKDKSHCRDSCEYRHHRCDDVDNFLLDCTAENQEDEMMPNDADTDIIEDLSLLMKKRQELESFLAERNRQLKELQEHHDLLKELVEQKEQEQMTVNGVRPPCGGKDGQLLTNSDRLPSGKMEVSYVQEFKGKIREGAAAQLQISSKCGNSHKKNLHSSGFKVKEDKEVVASDEENIRSSAKQDLDGISRRFKDDRDPWVENPADNSVPDSSELFADHTKMRQCKDTGELSGNGDIGKMTSDTECKYLQKSRKRFEIDEETASDTDADDARNSSLALRDELRHLSDKNKDDYLSGCDYADDSISNPEQVTGPVHNEAAIMKLQFNLSKLAEAKKEIEDLRSLLHDQTHQVPMSKTIKAPRASGLGEKKSSQKPLQEVKSPGTAVTFDTRDTDHKILQKLRLLKVANEKLDRLKLVMDEVQRFPGFSPPSNSAISPSTLEDRISTTKASNTSRASNLTSRLTPVGELAPRTPVETTEMMQSDQCIDATAGQPRSSNLRTFLQHHILDEKSSVQMNSKSTTASSGKNNCKSAMKNTVFIRNSLPESVSSLVTSHPHSGIHGGVEGPGVLKEKVKISSKNSSATNMSNVSCLPCVSKSADRLLSVACQQDSASASKPLDKNSKKPCEIIKNQHLESMSTAGQSLSLMFRRHRCGNSVEIAPYSKKGTKTRKKNIVVNTEGMQKNEVDENKQMRAELTNISREIKLLRQEVASLTQSVNCRVLYSDKKVEECQGDVLDPQLLVGLNQSFQQLLSDNRRLSERFCQLRDFVVKHSSGNQHLCEKSANKIFDIHEQNDGLRFTCDKHASYQAGNETVMSSDDTWVKQVINPLTTKDIQCGKSKCRHPACILAYMETDVTSQGAQSPRVNAYAGIRNNVEDCYSNNSNRNNSKSISVDTYPTMTFHSADQGKSPQEIDGRDQRSPAPNMTSENDSSTEQHRFDSLSEMIYSEVAVFISKHESRPHYLLELIKLLQKLKTSALRQHTVDAFDRIISDFLTDDQLSVPVLHNVKTDNMLHSRSDDTLPCKISACCEDDAVELEIDSSLSGGVQEEDLSDGENEVENYMECGSVSCCTDRAEEVEYGTSECQENLHLPEDCSENDSDLIEQSGDSYLFESEKLEENWQMMEGNLNVGSEADDILYPPDFKSTSSSNQEEEIKEMNLVNTPEPNTNAIQYQDLNMAAEQMGFVTIEFAKSSSLTLKVDSENEKGSSGSDESWEETEIRESDVDPHRNGSDSSSEIIEEIMVEDDSSESVEESQLDQPLLNLSSISKDDIARQMLAEYQGELSAQLILETMEPCTLNELAGDAMAVKQPGSSSFDDGRSRNI